MTAMRPASSVLTDLQIKALREVVGLVRREQRGVGSHLTEQALAQAVGVSRSPVQRALKHLTELGLLQHDAGRGYFVAQAPEYWQALAQSLMQAPDDPLYLRVAQDHFSGLIASTESENALMRRFQAPRGALRNVLARACEEGWAEQNAGHGWSFLPMIATPSAYEESYWFRLTLEPAALLLPSFLADAAELVSLREQQSRIVAGGFETMTAIELFESNSRFHEAVARWSGNRFIAQALKRANQQRRLVEYQQASRRAPRQTQAQEHVAILDAIASQDLITAANLMRQHLNQARQAKALKH